MKINGLARRVILLSAVGMGLAACAETQLAVHTAKRVAKVVQPRPFTVDEKKARKRTLRPYQIKGQWYYPKDDPDYDQTGIASWYGEPFHGRKTAIGEIYNMNAVSAAHKTLPLPSYVQVTNLDNGRVLRVRVNDRGPFVHGRIIDLSRRAAQLLGFERQGVAKVRVAVIGGENFVMASKEITPEESKGVQKAPQGRIAVETLPPPPGTKAASTVPAKVPAKTPAPKPTETKIVGISGAQAATATNSPNGVGKDLFVQAGAFTRYDNANRLRARLSTIGRVFIMHKLIDDRDFYRVRIGPLKDVAAADRALAEVTRQGVEGARIIVD